MFRPAKSGEVVIQSQSGDEAPSKAQSGVVLPIRIITHNIRYGTEAPFKGEEKWPIRRPHLCNELIFNSVVPTTFICLQEVLHKQLLDIIEDLNAASDGEWAHIGVGRDDGKEAGEYSPIFYRPSVWKVDSWDTIWLSETPRVPSKGWDAGNPRIATLGKFVHLGSKQKVIVASTHFDNEGKEARKHSAEMLPEILELEAELAKADATILAGDFNSPPSDEAYKIVTGKDSNLVDAWDLVPKEKHYGNENTFTGFKKGDEQDRIDFIFARKYDIGNVSHTDRYAVLPNRFEDGVYSSDHRAVVVDCHLGGN